MKTKLDERFFDSTRGRIVTLLRGTTKTVNDLAGELELTDNAVRAHLLSLERDGLIKQSGQQRGTRKPHFAYELTDQAENLFPKAYHALLNKLITVLKGQLRPATLNQVFREVGHSLADERATTGRRSDLESRAAKAVAALESLGGAARLEKDEGQFVIKSGSCPLSVVVAEHPEVCQLVEALLSEVVGSRVVERCNREGQPSCRFEVEGKSVR